jgi:hypothetical protein
MGYVEKGRFTGDIMFHLQVEGRVLNPPAGFILEGIVIRKNKMGMYISYDDAIRIILPRDIHIGDDAFEAVQIGDRVKVEVQKSRFQVNDAYILSVGLFRGLAASAAVPVAPVAEPVAEPVAAVPEEQLEAALEEQVEAAPEAEQVEATDDAETKEEEEEEV